VAIGRRIENDRLISITALCLPPAELYRVFNNPANRPVRQLGECRILSRSLDNTSRGVDMHDLGTRGSSRKRAPAGVSKQVQHANGT